MQDMRTWGKKKKWCPYFLARHMITIANVVVYNYQYMLDPKVSILQPNGIDTISLSSQNSYFSVAIFEYPAVLSPKSTSKAIAKKYGKALRSSHGLQVFSSSKKSQWRS